MRQRQCITLLAGLAAGRQQVARVRYIDWGRLLISGAMTYILLLSCSGAQEAVSQGGDVTSGQQVFNNACRTCHTTKQDDNRLGPHLNNIIGRRAGSLPDYDYSSAMRGAGFSWDKEKLERFIADPDELVPGNRMKPYDGLASDADRARIVTFLQSVTAGH
jgi:cytochrome c